MDIHHKLARSFGYELISIKKHFPTLESHLKNLFRELSINLVLDVGANNGGFGRMLRSIGYRGQICSFEPVPGVFQKLLDKTENDGRWHAFNYALGATEEKKIINIPEDDDFSSFLHANAYGREKWSKSFAASSRQTVVVKRLDDVFDELVKKGADAGEERNIFLKLDTQGFDLEVLKGASQCLDRITALQSEIALQPLYEQMPDYLEALSTFRRHGFELTGLYPVSRDAQNMLLVEMDCVMRRLPTKDSMSPDPPGKGHRS